MLQKLFSKKDLSEVIENGEHKIQSAFLQSSNVTFSVWVFFYTLFCPLNQGPIIGILVNI